MKYFGKSTQKRRRYLSADGKPQYHMHGIRVASRAHTAYAQCQTTIYVRKPHEMQAAVNVHVSAARNSSVAKDDSEGYFKSRVKCRKKATGSMQGRRFMLGIDGDERCMLGDMEELLLYGNLRFTDPFAKSCRTRCLHSPGFGARESELADQRTACKHATVSLSSMSVRAYTETQRRTTYNFGPHQKAFLTGASLQNRLLVANRISHSQPAYYPRAKVKLTLGSSMQFYHWQRICRLAYRKSLEKKNLNSFILAVRLTYHMYKAAHTNLFFR